VLQTPLANDKPTLAKQFQRAGYQTCVMGKMHFNQASRPGLHGFDHAMCEDAVTREWNKLKPSRDVAADVRTKPQPRWQPFRDPASAWLNAEKLPFARHEVDMRSHFLMQQACQYLEDHKDKQFALWVSFQEPHSPFDFPIEDAARFDAAKFDVPRVGPEDAWQIPLIFRDLSPDQKRGIVAAYYTSAHYLDRNLGRVLDKLRTLGLDDNTMVVYMADHGYSLGQHGRFEKHCGYDPALHVPLIARWPGRIRAGRKVGDMTEHIDVPATICDLMGLEPLPVLHGQSLRPYLEGKRHPSARNHIVSHYLENEELFARTDRWKYIFCSGTRKRTDGYLIDNPTPGRYKRLYDRAADPGEFTDVAARNPKAVAEMEDLILARFRKTHPDVGAEPGNLSREDALAWYARPRDAKA
jgi:choline-sulfatase